MVTYRSGDPDAMAKLYTANGSVYPTNSEPLRGTKNIKEFWVGTYNAGITDAKLETVSAAGYGNMAIEEGKEQEKRQKNQCPVCTSVDTERW